MADNTERLLNMEQGERLITAINTLATNGSALKAAASAETAQNYASLAATSEKNAKSSAETAEDYASKSKEYAHSIVPDYSTIVIEKTTLSSGKNLFTPEKDCVAIISAHCTGSGAHIGVSVGTETLIDFSGSEDIYVPFQVYLNSGDALTVGVTTDYTYESSIVAYGLKSLGS